MMTYLEDFKQNPAGAVPYLVLTFYDELVESKSLVLVRGDVTVAISKKEAQHLLKLVKSYYMEHYEHIDTFNNRHHEFDIEGHLSSCPQLEVVPAEE